MAISKLRYRTVPVTWVDDRQLLAASGDAFKLYWIIRCGPYMGSATGLCRVGAGSLVDTTDWERERVQVALEELHEAGLINMARSAPVIHVPGVVTNLPPDNPKHATGMLNDAESLPDCPPKFAFIHELAAALEHKQWDADSGLSKRIQDTLSQQSPDPSDTMPHGSADRSDTKPIQETERKQKGKETEEGNQHDQSEGLWPGYEAER